jgi:spermidine synthase
VLVIGGGDGGTLKQVLRHPNVESATLVDIDEQVIRMSQRHFEIAKSFTHPKARVVFRDGSQWVAQHRFLVEAAEQFGFEGGFADAESSESNQHAQDDRSTTRFDVILIDSTDFNRAVTLFTPEFYSNCKAILAEGGILVFNVESPSFSLTTIAEASERLKDLFEHVSFFQVSIPTYLRSEIRKTFKLLTPMSHISDSAFFSFDPFSARSGHYIFAMLSDEVSAAATPIDWAMWDAKKIATQYYNREHHYAQFTLPNFVRQAVAREHDAPRLTRMLNTTEGTRKVKHTHSG